MGAEPYYYFVPYQADINAALRTLRQREFEAGRYNPVMPFPSRFLPLGPDSPSPGRRHDSIEEALEDSDADGTRSILDIERVSDTSGLARQQDSRTKRYAASMAHCSPVEDRSRTPWTSSMTSSGARPSIWCCSTVSDRPRSCSPATRTTDRCSGRSAFPHRRRRTARRRWGFAIQLLTMDASNFESSRQSQSPAA